MPDSENNADNFIDKLKDRSISGKIRENRIIFHKTLEELNDVSTNCIESGLSNIIPESLPQNGLYEGRPFCSLNPKSCPYQSSALLLIRGKKVEIVECTYYDLFE